MAAGDSLRGGAGDRGGCAVGAARVAGEGAGLHGQGGAGQAGAAVGVVGAAVDRQRGAGIEVARRSGARRRDRVGRQRAARRRRRVDLGGEARVRAGQSGVVARGDGAGAGRRGSGEGVGAGGVGPAGPGDRAVVVARDSGVGVGRARGGDGEAAGGAALEVNGRAGTRVVAVGEAAEGEAGRRARRRRVHLDRGGDGGGVADVVGAGQRQEVAVAAGDCLRRRADDCRRCAVRATGVAGERAGLHGQGGGCEAGAAVGVVGAAVDRQRGAGV